jgi:hypothetical protein
MKIFKRLEKLKSFWYLIGILLLFFLLRLPSLIEPNWYGDEGIYQVIGQSINSGRLLYTEIWDNKPPLLYLVYALFNGDQFGTRLFSLITGLFATVFFFYLSRQLFKQLKSSIFATIIFVVLFATPLIEGNIANAENFMIPLVLLSGILIYALSHKNQNIKFLFLKSRSSTLLAAGLLLGISFLFKIVGIFDFAAFFIFLLITTLPPRFSFTLNRLKNSFNPTIKNMLPLIIGFILPIALTALYFLVHNAFSDFIKASFSANVGYVGWKNNFIVPQGFLFFKLILLTFAIIFIYRKRAVLSKPELFLVLWFVFSIFNTYFSGRPYMHYVLVTLPVFCLTAGLLIEETRKKPKLLILSLLILTVLLLNNTFKFSLNKSIRYYNNAVSFLSGNKSVTEYQAFFDRKTPRDYALSSFIKSHTTERDTVFLWGDSAQIYALSNKLPPGKYTVAYHISQYEDGIEETQKALNTSKPKYIITLKESRELPFDISAYTNRIVIEEGIIYERSL